MRGDDAGGPGVGAGRLRDVREDGTMATADPVCFLVPCATVGLALGLAVR